MIKRILVKIIRFYQKYISSGLRSSCIFKPTCSQYAVEAINKHGAIKGVLLAAYRVLRCNSFNKGGFDPVPDKKSVLKWLY